MGFSDVWRITNALLDRWWGTPERITLLVIIGDKHKATQTTENLCSSCRYHTQRRYANSQREDNLCFYTAPGRPERIQGAVSSCSDYIRSSHPFLEDMRAMAWTIERKSNVGFKATAPESNNR